MKKAYLNYIYRPQKQISDFFSKSSTSGELLSKIAFTLSTFLFLVPFIPKLTDIKPVHNLAQLSYSDGLLQVFFAFISLSNIPKFKTKLSDLIVKLSNLIVKLLRYATLDRVLSGLSYVVCSSLVFAFFYTKLTRSKYFEELVQFSYTDGFLWIFFTFILLSNMRHFNSFISGLVREKMHINGVINEAVVNQLIDMLKSNPALLIPAINEYEQLPNKKYVRSVEVTNDAKSDER